MGRYRLDARQTTGLQYKALLCRQVQKLPKAVSG